MANGRSVSLEAITSFSSLKIEGRDSAHVFRHRDSTVSPTTGSIFTSPGHSWRPGVCNYVKPEIKKEQELVVHAPQACRVGSRTVTVVLLSGGWVQVEWGDK